MEHVPVAARGRVPAALVIGLVAVAAASAILSVLSTVTFVRETVPEWGQLLGARLQLVAPATQMAAFAIALVGARQLGRGTAVGAIAPVGLALLLVSQVYLLYLRHWWLPGDGFDGRSVDAYRDRLEVRWWIACAGLVAFAGGLIAEGARIRRVQVLAAPLVVLAVLAIMPAPLARWLERALSDGSRVDLGGALAFDAIVSAIDVAFTVVALVVAREVVRARPPIPPPVRHPTDGLRLASTALMARVALAVGTPVLLIMASGSPGVVRVYLFVVPLAVVAAQVSLAVGLARACDGPDDDWPRRRLAVAAGLVVWGAVVQAIQLAELYQRFQGRDDSMGADLPGALMLGAPVVALAGLLAVVSAASALARRAGGSVDRDAVMSTGMLVTIASIAAIGLQYWMMEAVRDGRGGVGGVLVPGLLVAVATIAAHVSLSRVLRGVAGDVERAAPAAAELPVAEVRG